MKLNAFKNERMSFTYYLATDIRDSSLYLSPTGRNLSALILQLALIMLENVHWEFRRSSTGQAGRVAIQNMQIDNQLLTAAQPVILAKAFRVRTVLL